MTMRHRLPLAMAIAVAAGIPALRGEATTPPVSPPPPTRMAVHTYAYQPDHVYTVRTGLGITTQLELSPEETVLDYSAGFSAGWDITRRDNVFYIKPKNVDVDTNLMIRTATHAYILELKVAATDWRTLDEARQAGVQYKVVFTYPVDESFSPAKAAPDPSPALDTGLVKGRAYHFGYDYAKTRRTAPWLVPVNAYDDGRFTYIVMPDASSFPTGNFPTVYSRENAHADDNLVNTTVEGNTIVVHGTYPFLVIRHGKNTVGLRRKAPK